MARSEIEVDAALAQRAEEVAAKRGESVEAVIERALRAYVSPDSPEDRIRRR